MNFTFIPFNEVCIEKHCLNLTEEELDFCDRMDIFLYPIEGAKVMVYNHQIFAFRFHLSVTPVGNITQILMPFTMNGVQVPGIWLYLWCDQYGDDQAAGGSLEEMWDFMHKDIMRLP